MFMYLQDLGLCCICFLILNILGKGARKCLSIVRQMSYKKQIPSLDGSYIPFAESKTD